MTAGSQIFEGQLRPENMSRYQPVQKVIGIFRKLHKLIYRLCKLWMPTLFSQLTKTLFGSRFHEIAVIDLPTIIDYILTTTDNTSLTYIGHSMGCSVFLVLMSTKPEYCSKVDTMIALAPAVYGKHIRNMGFRPIILLGNFVVSENPIWLIRGNQK